MSATMRPRLLPVVIAAASGLLTLKVVGLATQGGYLLPPPAPGVFARSVTEARRNPTWALGEDVTGAAPAKKPAETAPEKKPEQSQPMPPPGVTQAEREVLEQLAARRRQLDEKAKELDLREQLLKTAEKMAQERLDDLRKGEGKSDAPAEKSATEMKSLVVLYEAMKPREAARIFDRMPTAMLAPLARQMQPRKLAEIVAAMTPETAEKLTAVLMPPSPRAEALRPAPQPQLEELQRLPKPGG